jgi:hypothetical protein
MVITVPGGIVSSSPPHTCDAGILSNKLKTKESSPKVFARKRGNRVLFIFIFLSVANPFQLPKRGSNLKKQS